MFWGITIQAGKLYSQIIERSFHISMAALGLDCPSNESLSVLVEVDKAQYVLCTLQAGKIPQQTLDLNFTEGEEVKLFLEGPGKGGEVHLTGYLYDTPREIEFDDDDEPEEISDSDEEEATTDSDDNEDNDGMDVSNNDAERPAEELALADDLNSSGDEADHPMGWNPTSKETVSSSSSDSSSDDDDDGDSDGVSWHDMINSELTEEDVDSSGDDWSPEKSDLKTKSTSQKNKNVKSKRLSSDSVNGNKPPVSQTLIDLMDMNEEDDDDDDWQPSEEKPKIKKKKMKPIEQKVDIQDIEPKQTKDNGAES